MSPKRTSAARDLLRVLLCVLVCSGLALDCGWDPNVDPDQGLDLFSVQSGSVLKQTEVSDPNQCRAACCTDPDCDLVLLGFPADGGPQCTLVRCWIQNRDRCDLKASDQFKVYKKNRTRSGTAGNGSKLAPLMEVLQTATKETEKTNETAETNNIRCRLPMKVGSCRAAFSRFYYDVTNQSCRSFTYGGCEANGNNFNSRDDCEKACTGVTGSVLPDESTPPPPPIKAARMVPALRTNVSQDPEGPVESEAAPTETSADDFAERCGAEPDIGPCRAAFKRWSYNKETGSCQPFIYGGCRGNKNNYESEESCIAACTVSVLPSSKKSAADEDEEDEGDKVSAEFKAGCLATPDPGPCRAAFPSFYYDPNTATCQSFIYGGCRGNQNRYGSVEDCLNRCSNTHGSFRGRGQARDRWTAAVFLFLTLTAISALLLATLVFITLRRRGVSRRPSSISDKEELLPDPDESSVDSLSVPESPKPEKI
ncbi:kunitz-type protease inhibitor 2 [Symphorus nematophorus]